MVAAYRVNAFPERFGDYLLLKRLSESLMAEVFVAIRLGDRDGRTVVLKRPRLGERASGESAQAVVREAEVLGDVHAPTLIALEAKGAVAGLPFVAVEHVRGVPLDRLLARRGTLDPAAAVSIGRDVLRALSALHDGGWVHADVAPSNVVVDDAGEAKLIDLGIAMHVGEARITVAGKPGYVAPEVPAHRPAAPAEDVYAAAAVIAECLLGRRLFPDRDLAEAATRAEVPSAIAMLPHGEWLVRALAITPSERPSARELAAALPEDASGRNELARVVQAVATEPDAPESRLAIAKPATRNGATGAIAKTEISMPLTDVASSITTRGEAAFSAEPSRAGASTSSSRWKTTVLVLVALVIAGGASVVGFLAGRRTTRPRDASISLPAVAPRTEIVLDGRTVVVTEPGRAIPISAGKHTLSLSIRKREKDLEFVAKEGDNIYFVPVLMAKNPSPDPSAERPHPGP